MIAPPFLIGSALMFWGVQTGLIIPAILMAIALEGSRYVSFRLNLALTDYYRMWDLCGLIFLALMTIMYVSKTQSSAILDFAQWLPVVFIPMVLAQVYGSMEKIELGVFLLVFRKAKNIKDTKKPISINVVHMYFALIIVSASIANIRTAWFYIGLCILSAWALWAVRPKQYSAALWAGLLCVACLGGYAGSAGLVNLQSVLDEKFLEFYSRLLNQNPDPSKAYTAIGEIRTLKQSNKIVFRMERADGYAHAAYLPRSSYNAYRMASWYAMGSPFLPLEPQMDRTTWALGKVVETTEKQDRLTIWSVLDGDKGILTIPMDSFQISNLPVEMIKANRMGAVVVERWPGYFSYDVSYSPSVSMNGAPDDIDLAIPEKARPAIEKIAEQLNLASRTPDEKLQIINNWFTENFKYSLNLESGRYGNEPLEDFLFRTKAGHCEYFASASVLLLRQAGIPARYAVGYLAHEYSPLEKKIIVRSRDAHAWAIAYINGKWRIFDTTPPSWVEEERNDASMFEPLSDLWYYLSFTVSKWRWSYSLDEYKTYFLLAIALAVLYMGRGFFSRSKVVQRKTEGKKQTEALYKQGADSGFYKIEKQLADDGVKRNRGETFSRWISRLELENADINGLDQLDPILKLHNRHRFDPNGLTEDEQEQLSQEANSWVENNCEIEADRSKM